jgi:multiple sugar transport system substrate-binding protein
MIRAATTRRTLLARAAATGSLGALAAAGLIRPAWAATQLSVIGHAVHQRSVSEGPGGDVLAEWAAASDAEVEWITLGVNEIHERLYRELGLGSGQLDVAYILHRLLRPSVFRQVLPLDDFQADAPIDDLEGIGEGMRASFSQGGQLFAIPYRHATDGLHYNRELLEERGVTDLPRTLEELVELAERLTYVRADGTQVHGLIIDGLQPSNVINLARAWDGDFITSDFRVACNEPGMVNAVTLVKTLFDKGILPRAIVTFTTEDVITFMQQGRAAMAISPFGRFRPFNDPAQSRFPGAIDVTTVPIADELKDRFEVAPAKTDIWAIAIPANGRHAELAWSYIRHVSSPDATVLAALNGNGPVRAAAYDDPRVQQLVPYWQAEATVVRTARPTLPGFEQAQRAQDMFIEEVQGVLLGAKAPQQAMDDLARRLAPLMPS